MSEIHGYLVFLQSCSLSLCLEEAGGISFAVPIDVEEHKFIRLLRNNVITYLFNFWVQQQWLNIYSKSCSFLYYPGNMIVQLFSESVIIYSFLL